MSDDAVFHVLFIIVLTPFAFVWLAAAWRAGLNRQFFYHTNESLLIALPIRLLVLVSLLAMAVYVFAPHWTQAVSLSLPDWLRYLGVPMALLATWLFHAVFTALGEHFSTSLRLKDNHRLIKNGPYQYARHPMYVAYQSQWLAFALISGNWLIGLCGLLAFSYVMITRTPHEEQMMLKAFGDEYRIYMKNTGRFIPKRRAKKTRNAVTECEKDKRQSMADADSNELGEQQSKQLQQQLLTLQQKLLSVLQDGDAAKPVELDQQMFGRVSRIDAIQQQQMAKAGLEQARQQLRQVGAALAKMETDDYGYCQCCDESIGFARLQARPETALCLKCQTSAESG